jgi:hypothetical protein
MPFFRLRSGSGFALFALLLPGLALAALPAGQAHFGEPGASATGAKRASSVPLRSLTLPARLKAIALKESPAAPAYIPPRGYVCYRAPSPITIDGKLDDAAWQAAPWSEWFVDIEGDKKPAPRLRTRMKMLWDDECLYIAAELEEPHVWATLTKHDSVIFHDNDFEVFLDPDGDNHVYGELEINALNTTWDLLLTKPYRDGGRAIDDWEISGLRTAVHVDGTLNDPRDRDRGWTVEIAWPWKGMRQLASRPMPPFHGDQWRINFSRVEWDVDIIDGKYRKVPGRPEHNWVWSPQHVIDMHRPEQWGYVQFSTATPGTDVYRPDPSGPARALLHRIYYAQHAYRRQHGAFATSLDELGIGRPWPDGVTPPRLQTTDSLFEASLTFRRRKSEKPQHWHIRDDSRLWSD